MSSNWPSHIDLCRQTRTREDASLYQTVYLYDLYIYDKPSFTLSNRLAPTTHSMTSWNTSVNFCFPFHRIKNLNAVNLRKFKEWRRGYYEWVTVALYLVLRQMKRSVGFDVRVWTSDPFTDQGILTQRSTPLDMFYSIQYLLWRIKKKRLFCYQLTGIWYTRDWLLYHEAVWWCSSFDFHLCRTGKDISNF